MKILVDCLPQMKKSRENAILPSGRIGSRCSRRSSFGTSGINSFERPSITTVQDSLDKLKSAFREALPLPDDVNYDQVVYGQTAGWDSIAHMKLIAAIETQFDVMFTTDELIGLSSFSKARELLQQYSIRFE
jgi:acyl carrier protein